MMKIKVNFWFEIVNFLIFFCISCSVGLPVVRDAGLDKSSLGHLQKWGYLDSVMSLNELKSNHQIVDALKTFQRFAYIEPTGFLDNATRRMMNTPRCGMPDVYTAEEEENHRKRRFNAQGSRWQNRQVTWQLENTNNDGLTVAQVRSFMARSLKKWSDKANIDFIEVPPTPGGPQAPASQIRVRFDIGDHGDGFPFDGRSGTLAHAFFPLNNQGLSGDIHFDDAEIYTILDPPQSSGQIKFYWVAVHELGHSLGLSHSNLFGAIMYPFYLHFPGQEFELTQDDVLGIQSIYGPKSTSPVSSSTTTSTTTTPGATVTVPPTTAAPVPTSCITRASAVHLYNGSPYIFNDRVFYVSNNRGFIRPRPDGSFPRKVDAVHRKVSNPNQVVFMHDDTFTVYDSRTNVLIYSERKITVGYQGLPSDFTTPDAAFIFPRNNKLYLFKGNEYWRMTENEVMDYEVDFDYPKKIHLHWNGVPDNLDAAFVYTNNEVYFFKDNQYYRYDSNRLETRHGYPQPTNKGFMQCDTTTSAESLKKEMIFFRS